MDRAEFGQIQELYLGSFDPNLSKFCHFARIIFWEKGGSFGSTKHEGLVNTDSIEWVETAAGGVRRKMIERHGELFDH